MIDKLSGDPNVYFLYVHFEAEQNGKAQIYPVSIIPNIYIDVLY